MDSIKAKRATPRAQNTRPIAEVNVGLPSDAALVESLQSLFDQLSMSYGQLEEVIAKTESPIPTEALESKMNITLDYEKVAVKAMSYLQEKIDG